MDKQEQLIIPGHDNSSDTVPEEKPLQKSATLNNQSFRIRSFENSDQDNFALEKEQKTDVLNSTKIKMGLTLLVIMESLCSAFLFVNEIWFWKVVALITFNTLFLIYFSNSAVQYLLFPFGNSIMKHFFHMAFNERMVLDMQKCFKNTAEVLKINLNSKEFKKFSNLREYRQTSKFL